MVSCACSAGPAFEGGDISCGMRATDGAIEKCTIDPETMEPSYHVIGDEGTKPIGLCGSGIIDVIAAQFRAKMVNPKGNLSGKADGSATTNMAWEAMSSHLKRKPEASATLRLQK